MARPSPSPLFYANEDALVIGVRATLGVAWSVLEP